MFVSCVHSIWKLTLELSLKLYWPLELFKYETSHRRSSCIQFDSPGRLSWLPSPLWTSASPSPPLSPLLVFLSSLPPPKKKKNPLWCPQLLPFSITLITLFSPLHSSISLSPALAYQVSVLSLLSALGLLQPLLPAGLPSVLLCKCRKLFLS